MGGSLLGRAQENFLERRWDPIWEEENVLHPNLRGGDTGGYTCKNALNYLLKILQYLSYTSIKKKKEHAFDDTAC